MAEDIKSPQFPESIFEGTLSTWLKKEGDTFQQDDVLAEIETDKVVIEVTAQSDGQLEKIIIPEGSVIKSQETIGNYSKKITEKQNKEQSKPIAEEVKTTQYEKKEEVIESPKIAPKQQVKGKIGPAAKKLLQEKNLTTENITPTRKKGIITKEDILTAAENSKPVEPEKTTKKMEVKGDSKRVPMSRLRSVVAKRLLESQAQTASLTTFNEVDLFEIKKLREKYRESFENKYDVKLGFMGMFIKASSIALQDMPIVNASIDGEDVVYHGFQDIGVAVSSERGLVVPVIKNVQELSIAEIEKEVRDYSMKARDGKLEIDDITGGTFTISNGGVFGSLLSTPILNPPQSAVLGMHNIVKRPIVINGNIEVRPVMYLALSYDHRIIDGKEAVSFLKIVKESLEQPKRLFLNI